MSVPALQEAIGLGGALATRILALALAAAEACGSSAPEQILTELRAAADAAEEAGRRLRSFGEVLAVWADHLGAKCLIGSLVVGMLDGGPVVASRHCGSV